MEGREGGGRKEGIWTDLITTRARLEVDIREIHLFHAQRAFRIFLLWKVNEPKRVSNEAWGREREKEKEEGIVG